jgi:rod shape-determining protein MreC
MWLVVGAVLLVLWNLPDGLTGRMKDVVREGVAPLQELFSSTSHRLTETTRSIKGLSELLEENKAYESELIQLRNRVSELRQFEVENFRLRKQLNYLERIKTSLITAEVIGRDVSGWWQSIRLNKGTGLGIQSQRAVLTAEGVIGRTTEVSLRTADVLLLTDPNCHVSALIPRVNGFGIVTGQGVGLGGQILLKMRFINRNIPVRPGDEVITSGLGGVFPRGMQLGRVERVDNPETGLHQVVQIRPAADFGAVHYAFVHVDEGQSAEDVLMRRIQANQELP